MSVREIFKLAIAMLVCAAALSVIVLWNEMPGSVVDCPSGEPPANSDDAVGPYTIHHCFRVVPAIERVIKVVTAMIAFSGLAYVSVSAARRAKVLVGAGACAASAVSAWLVLSYVHGRVLGTWLVPALLPFVTVCAIAGAFGTLASWAFARWWPNKSLERTREG